MAIKKANELVTSNVKLRVILAGYPGIGKTTLAMSAPKPLLIDADKGVYRVRASHRKDTIEMNSYQEILDDLKPENLKEYETIVVDTGGRLLELMKEYVINKDPKYAQKDTVTLSLKGYGAIGKEFSKFVDMCFYDLNKNVIIIFHAKEEKNDDVTKLRLLVEGQTKDNVWQPVDLGGFIEMQGNQRTIGFTNCERYFAKGTHGIKGICPIPELDDNTPNDFLTKLFEKVNQSIAEEKINYEKQKEVYDKIMARLSALVVSASTENLNSVLSTINKATHALTSEKELKHLLAQKAEELGCKYDKEKKSFMKKEG